MALPPTVFIVYDDRQVEDSDLAREIERQVSTATTVVLMPVRKLEQQDGWVQAPLAIGLRRAVQRMSPGVDFPLPGVTVTIVSRTMIDPHARRRALVEVVAPPRHFSFRHYWLCLGLSPDAIRAHADLSPLFEQGAIVGVADLPELIDDIRLYAGRRLPQAGIGVAFKTLSGTVMAPVLLAIARVSWHPLLAAAALGAALWLNASPRWLTPLSLLCLYMAGLGLSRVDPLDLWPWLGRHWQLPVSVNAAYLGPFPTFVGPVAFWSMAICAAIGVITRRARPAEMVFLSGAVLQTIINVLAIRSLPAAPRGGSEDRETITVPPGPSCDSACPPQRLGAALNECLALRRFAVHHTFNAVILLLVVAVLAAARVSWRHFVLDAFIFIAGLATAPGSAWFLRLALLEPGRSRGLTRNYVERMRRILDGGDLGRPPGVFGSDESLQGFTAAEQAQLAWWLARYRMKERGRASWHTPADYAFISYAWRDNERTRMATRLAHTFGAIGVSHFLDRQEVESRFVVWRERVSPALSRCSHFFLIVSPAIGQGDMVLREAETAMDRWYFERLPAVICVAEPETARTLRADPAAPLRLRFFLTFCPVMSFVEALDPRLLRYIVAETRRQGMLQDWLTALAGATPLQRILRMRGIVETAPSPPPPAEP
jgi:hypothetical protein